MYVCACVYIYVCVYILQVVSTKDRAGRVFTRSPFNIGAHVFNGCLCGVAVLPGSELISITKVISKNKRR